MPTQFSKIILGTVQFGLPYGIANTLGQPSFKTVKEILALAYDHGIDTLDTAASYGESEIVLGQALHELKLHGKMHLISKVPPLPPDASPAEFAATSLAQSLRNLRCEALDGLLFHREDDLPHLPVLQQLQDRGLTRGIGVSLDSSKYVSQAGTLPLLQVPCNVLDHRFDALIAGHPGQLFLRSVYLQGLLLLPEEQIHSELAAIIPWRRRLAELGLPMKELCFRYLLSLPGRVSILTGVDSVAQLQENIRLASLGPLPAELLAAVRNAVPLLPEQLIRPCLWPARKKKE
ncbi:MAG: aldo/keto reductase [Oligosphaeraceae bacterium]|nr:aldo/keto reductase [Oligosphaeraceae bacterium]